MALVVAVVAAVGAVGAVAELLLRFLSGYCCQDVEQLLSRCQNASNKLMPLLPLRVKSDATTSTTTTSTTTTIVKLMLLLSA